MQNAKTSHTLTNKQTKKNKKKLTCHWQCYGLNLRQTTLSVDHKRRHMISMVHVKLTTDHAKTDTHIYLNKLKSSGLVAVFLLLFNIKIFHIQWNLSIKTIYKNFFSLKYTLFWNQFLFGDSKLALWGKRQFSWDYSCNFSWSLYLVSAVLKRQPNTK